MHPAGSKAELIIIGGGASGLAAACVAVQRGHRVIVLESREKPGRKLLATGNGRCNILTMQPPCYFGRADFAQQVLAHCPREQVMRFFEGLGLTLHVEDSGLVYPASNQAASVVEVLHSGVTRGGLGQIVCGAEVIKIVRKPEGFDVKDSQGRVWRAPRLIVAAGGLAQPQLSGAQGMYEILQGLGHHVTPLRPALSGLVTEARDVKGLKGLRVPAVATLCRGDQPVAQTQGEVLFAQDGISGVCVMQLSRAADEILSSGGRARVYLDLRPMLGLMPRRYERQAPQAPGQGEAQVLRWLSSRAQRLHDPLLGAVPGLLAARLRGMSVQETASMLSAFALEAQAVRGFEHAQVTAGGLDCDEVDAATMRSRLVDGLHITGELLDVDGDCGGHNLLFAWATGILAGQSA